VIDKLLADVRLALRMLRSETSLSVFAILIIGLGIGATAIVFSVFHTLLLRPLPFDDPARLVWIANGRSANLSAQTVQVSNLLDFRAQSKNSFSATAAYSPFYGIGDIRLLGVGEPERVTAVPVTENFFTLLGVRPQLGRNFTSEECQQDAAKTALMTHALWSRRFASDPAVVGRTIVLDGAAVTVTGVLPASFDFAKVFAPGTRVDLFVPFPLGPASDRKGNTLALIGRLTPNATLAAAQAEAKVIGERLAAAEPRERRNRFQPVLSTLRERVSGKFQYALIVVFGATGFLLLLVCANLSNLLLTRASGRGKEMAIRTALGASRGRIVQHALAESLTLGCLGGALGLVLAWAGTAALASLENTAIPLLQDVRVDPVSLLFALAAACLAGILAGVVPALQVSAAGSPYEVIKDGGRGQTASKERSWVRSSIVVAQIALACVLLTGAGLLIHSLVRILHVDLGFDVHNVVTVRIDPARTTHRSLSHKTAYFDEMLQAARGVPGVQSAGLTDALPFGQNYGWRNWTVRASGQVYERGSVPVALVRIVDDGYLETMRIPIRSGRNFTVADNPSTEQVAIVNEPLAKLLWPGQDPIGRTLSSSGVDRRVVGVVQDVRYFGFEQASGPEMYFSIRQTGDFSVVDLAVRAGTGAGVDGTASALRAALKSVDPNLPAAEFRTMQDLADRTTFARRSVVMLVSGFAGFALLLALVGLYAVISYSVSRRKQEIGIRMALGATGEVVRANILLQTGRLVMLGLGVGLPVSWMAARLLQSLLYEVAFTDATTFAAVFTLMAFVALAAGYMPARRASKLNPVEALRAD